MRISDTVPLAGLRQQAVTHAEAEPAGSARPIHRGSRHGPDSQEMKLLLLDPHEEIIQLQRSAGHHAWFALMVSSCGSHPCQGTRPPEEWARLAQDLGDVERDLDQMVGRLRLDRSLLFNIYHRMLTV